MGLLNRRFNYLLIGIAILVGLLYVGPSLMVWKNFNASGNEFVLANFKNSAAIQQYLQRAREIYDGHWPPAEIYGLQPSVTVQNPLPSTLFAAFIFLAGGNMNIAYLGVLFVFSIIIFLLFYFLGKALFSSRLWAIFFSLVAVLTTMANIAKEIPFLPLNFTEFQGRFINEFIPIIRTQIYQLPLFRFDEPLLTYPIFLSAILFFYLFWQNPSRPRAVLSGFFTGLLFYTYFHHWVYWLIVLGLLFLYVLFFQRSNKVLVRNYLVIFGVLAVTVIPYFTNYILFSQMPDSQDFAFREGLVYGRGIGIVRENIVDYLTYFGMAALIYFVYWKRDRQKAILFLALVAAMIIAWNVQLVTGMVPIPGFFRRPINLASFLIFFDLLFALVKKLEFRWPSMKKWFVVAMVFLAFLVVLKKTINVFALGCCMQTEVAEENRLPNEVVQSWQWINDNLVGEPVIVSPSGTSSMYLPAYTSARPFLPTGFITTLSMRDVEDRFLLVHKLFGISKEFLRERLMGKLPLNCDVRECYPDDSNNLNGSFDVLYGYYFEGKYGSLKAWLAGPDAHMRQKEALKIEELLDRYGKLNVSWKDIDEEYVYIGPWERQIIGEDFLLPRNFELVYKNSLVAIYKIFR